MSLIGTIFGGTRSAVAHVWTVYFTKQSKIAALELVTSQLQSTILQLQKEKSELEEVNAAQQIRIVELEKQIAQHVGHDAIRAKYTVEETTGDFLKDGLHFCAPCFYNGGDSPPEIQMKRLNNGQYQCPVCGLPRRNVSFPTRGHGA